MKEAQATRFKSITRSIAGLSFSLLLVLAASARPALTQSDEDAPPDGKAAVSKLSISATTLIYDLNLDKKTSETRHFTITNDGKLPLDVSVGPPSNPHYVITSGGGDTTIPGKGEGGSESSIAVDVEFTPDEPGKNVDGTILITSSATSGPTRASVDLHGKATATPSPAEHTIGGTVSALSGSGLVLQNNGSNNLAVTANGSFTFSSKIAAGSTYSVTVLSQPAAPAQPCSVKNSTGTVGRANVTNVAVTCTTTPSCSGVPTITTGSVTWTPQWCQEFNGAAAPPDTTVWSFDLGNNHGWGNKEVEVYCGPPGYPGNPSQCPTEFSTTTNTVYIDGDGHLVIQPINNNETWLSTRMKTEGLENFQYGLIEASLHIPDTTKPGLWPAFWSLGSDYPETSWPNCGEADFMEDWSAQVAYGPGPAGVVLTIHTAETGGTGIPETYEFPSGQQSDTAFHTYGVIWSADMMEFYVDNPSAPFFIVTAGDLPQGDTWPFDADIFLIMNVAVGGTLGGSTGGLINPQPMMADYVRWYTSSSDAVEATPAFGNPASITVNAGATASTELTPQLTPGER